MLFLHYLLCVCVQEKKESRLNSINHRIPASRKLSPPQTAIKCSVLRKWPIESMCVCVCFTWQNNRLVVFFFAGVGGRSMFMETKQTSTQWFLLIFSKRATQRTLNVMTYWKGLWILFFFSFHLCGGECSRYSRNVFRKNDFRQELCSERICIFCIFVFAVNSLKVQCSAYA